MKDRIEISLFKFTSNILIVFCLLFSAVMLTSIFTALYFIFAEPPNLPCLACVGCPCPYRDFLIAKHYYLNFLFPRLMIFNIFFIGIFTILTVFTLFLEKELTVSLK
jgi:hypothetical protein